MLHLKPVSYQDKACTGMEAFSLLMPEGWDFQGGVRWSADDTMLPASFGFLASGNGLEVRSLPGQAFFWTSLPHVRLSHPVGTRYLGAMVCPPQSASEFISGIVLPALRPQVEDLSIVGGPQCVDMGSTLGFGATFHSPGTSKSTGARARVEYRQDGIQYEEELYCVLTSFVFSAPVGDSSIDYLIWMADPLFSFRAEAGRLDPAKDLLQTMMYSFRLNPLWLDKTNRIVLFLKDHQVQKPYSLRQLSVDVDQAAVSCEDCPQAFVLRQSAYRWIADSLCGDCSTAEYYDPIQQISVRLPGNYSHAWSSDTGEYLLSDSGALASDSHFSEVWKALERISHEPPVGEPAPTPATCAFI